MSFLASSTSIPTFPESINMANIFPVPLDKIHIISIDAHVSGVFTFLIIFLYSLLDLCHLRHILFWILQVTRPTMNPLFSHGCVLIKCLVSCLFTTISDDLLVEVWDLTHSYQIWDRHKRFLTVSLAKNHNDLDGV